jgi:hypothetical protein
MDESIDVMSDHPWSYKEIGKTGENLPMKMLASSFRTCMCRASFCHGHADVSEVMSTKQRLSDILHYAKLRDGP